MQWRKFYTLMHMLCLKLNGDVDMGVVYIRFVKCWFFFSHQFDTDFAKPPFFSALLLGREEEAVPRGSGNTHPEDLPWLEVPHSFSPVEEEPGGGGRLVPKICGEHHSLHLPQKTFFFFWDQYTELFLVWKCLVVFYCSNKRSTRTSGPLP